MCHIRMLLKRNTFTAANSKKKKKNSMCYTKSFAHFFLYIVAFVSTISLHVTLIFFAPGSKKLPSARPCVLLFHTVKGLSEFLKDD